MVRKCLIALALVGLVDSISFMVVAPSIVFYVLDNGGTKEQYGLIMSIFSFSSFCTKPLVGHFSDVYGFRLLYFATLCISCLGGILYLTASSVTSFPVTMIFVARLLGGIGAANAALGYAYLAKVVPHGEQTKTNSILSMTRIIGMTVGPALNIFLTGIDVTMFHGHLKVDYMNAAGLVLILSNVLAIMAIAVFLDEPHCDHCIPHKDTNVKDELCSIVRAVCHFKILLPMFAIFTMNANFQLVETSLAPAASHALGWTPVEVSFLMGGMSIVIFIMMAVVIFLSAKGVKDIILMMIGCCIAAIGYYMTWYFWQWKTSTFYFILPILIGVSAYPFLAAPTRSVFTRAVDQYGILREHAGSMQALLSMSASVGGFATPGLVAAYILRTPTEVEEAQYPHHRELSKGALFAPILLLIVLVGNIWIWMNTANQEELEGDESNETTKLLRFSSSIRSSSRRPLLRREYSSKVMVHINTSTTMIGGIVQENLPGEKHYMDHDDEEE